MSPEFAKSIAKLVKGRKVSRTFKYKRAIKKLATKESFTTPWKIIRTPYEQPIN